MLACAMNVWVSGSPQASQLAVLGLCPWPGTVSRRTHRCGSATKLGLAPKGATEPKVAPGRGDRPARAAGGHGKPMTGTEPAAAVSVFAGLTLGG